MSTRGAVFLDRDGVLTDVVWRGGRPGSARRLDELRIAADARVVDRLRDAGMPMFVVTNQPDVARGLLAPTVHEQMVQYVRSSLPVDDLRCCVHDDGDDCACRKPRPGMLLDLAAAWPIELAASYMVGDSWRDMAAGRAAGCRTVLLSRPYNEGVDADMQVASLTEAVTAILSSEQR